MKIQKEIMIICEILDQINKVINNLSNIKILEEIMLINNNNPIVLIKIIGI